MKHTPWLASVADHATEEDVAMTPDNAVTIAALGKGYSRRRRDAAYRRISAITAMGLALVVLGAVFAPLGAQTETICEDCPSYSGEYSIENTTGGTINYQYRWGSNHQWKRMALASGSVETHSYPLGDSPYTKVPTPYVRFDNFCGNNNVTWTQYRMEFYALRHGGYGAPKNKTRPKPYFFVWNGQNLDLKSKRW
jgi:hypothetical protein